MRASRAGCAVLLLLTACGGGSTPKAASPSASTSSTPSAKPTTPPDRVVALTDGDAPQNPFLAFGSLWVAAHHASAVIRIDPATGKVLARIRTGSEPGGIVAGADRVWVTHYGEAKLLVAINPTNNTVARSITLPGESCCQPAVLGATVWVTAGSQDEPGIVAIDVASGRVGKRIFEVDGPVIVDGRLWASHGGSPAVVDPAAGTITDTAAPSGTVLWASPALDGLTYASQGGTVIGMGADGSVQRTVTGPDGAKLSVNEIMVVTSGKNVWATDGESRLWRIDPGATTPTLVADLGRETLSIAGDGTGGVWIALFDHNRLEHYAPSA